MTLDFSNLIIISPEADEPEQIPWPRIRKHYEIEFEVEHIGPNYDDTPDYTILNASSDDLGFILAEHQLTDLIDSYELPIASGVYSCVLEYWHFTNYESYTGCCEDDYGFYLSKLEKVQ